MSFNFLLGALPILCLLPLVIIAHSIIFIRQRNTSKRRNPLRGELLRSPGETLRNQIDEMSSELMAYLSFTPVIPLMLYSGYLSVIYFGSQKPSIYMIVFYCLIGVGMTAFTGRKIYLLAKRRNFLTLGYEAELAVAQELNQLAHEGYWVFHDFPADSFNIDHVIVGPSGIFAIETKGRAKPLSEEGKAEWNVQYDGQSLKFPGWQETKPIEQAKRQASWLQNWLSNVIGEPVLVTPALALPGWYIDWTGKGIRVFNGKNCAKMFAAKPGNELSEKIIKQVSYQLDQRCRNVKPLAYKSTNLKG